MPWGNLYSFVLAPAILISTTLLFLALDTRKELSSLATSTPSLMHNLELERSIRTKLETDDELRTRIDVRADAATNRVTLSGVVGSDAVRHRAIELTKAARLGLTIYDRIAVKPAA